MGKLYAEWSGDSDDRWGSYAVLDSSGSAIQIQMDDPSYPAHAAVAHEVAHVKLGHHEEFGGLSHERIIARELEAVELQVYYLTSVGEWNPGVRRDVIRALATYFREGDVVGLGVISGDLAAAAAAVDVIERRVRKRLGTEVEE